MNIKRFTDPDHPFFDRIDGLLTSAQLIQRKTLKQISEEAGINYGALTHYKDRYYLPSTNNLLRLADYFGVSTDYLLGREGYELEDDK